MGEGNKEGTSLRGRKTGRSIPELIFGETLKLLGSSIIHWIQHTSIGKTINSWSSFTTLNWTAILNPHFLHLHSRSEFHATTSIFFSFIPQVGHFVCPSPPPALYSTFSFIQQNFPHTHCPPLTSCARPGVSPR